MKVQILNFDKTSRIPKAHLVKLGRKLFKKFSTHAVVKKTRPLNYDEFCDLSIVFLNEKRARALNKKYRKKDYATDILSFTSKVPRQGLGELVLCAKVLKRQAKEHKHSFKKELDYMVIHGFLHLLGYDHEKSPQEELKMMKLQDKLFRTLSED